MNRLILFTLLLFISDFAYSQSTIKGKVIFETDLSPVFGVNVTVRNPKDSTTIAYAVTNELGEFSIKINEEQNGLLLFLRAMTINPISLLLTRSETDLEIRASPAQVELKEFTLDGIKNPVSFKKDTLSYSVDGFATQNDRVISDLLRRLPGIEVSENGMIRYQGRPLQKFYIDGLDLLEGRYNLANNAIPIDAVESVEILENHQPIRALDSLVFSDRASLNLKLRRKNVWIGTGYLGVGGSPLTWNGSFAPMVFKQNFQMLNTFQSNNFGVDLANQLEVLTIEDLEKMSNPEEITDWVSIPRLFTGIIPKKRYLFNTSHLGSANFLTKNEKETEFRLNLSYIQQSNRERNDVQTIFFFPDGDSLKISEQKANDYIDRNLISELTWTRNLSKNFFKNTLNFEVVKRNESSETFLNDSLRNQLASLPYFRVGNSLKLLKPIKRYLIDFNSDLSFQGTDQSLTLSPGGFGDILDNADELEKLTQDVQLLRFYSNNSIGIKTNLTKRISYQPTIGVKFQMDDLYSGISIAEPAGESVPLGNRFTNDITYKKINPYLNSNFDYKSDKLNVRLELPLNYLWVDIEGQNSDFSNRISKYYLEPYFYSKYLISGKFFTTISFRKRNTFSSLYENYSGLIVKNYRSIYQWNTNLPELIGNNLTYSLNFKDPISSVFFNGRITYSKSSNNTLLRSFVLDSGESLLSGIDLFSNSEVLNYGIQGSKYFSTIYSTFSVTANFQNQNRPQIINDSFVRNSMKSGLYGLEVSIKPKNIFGLYFRSNFSTLTSELESEKISEVTQLNSLAKLEIFPIENHLFTFSWEWVSSENDFQNSKEEISFLDLSYRLKIPKKKIDLNLIGNNLLDNRIFSNYFANSFILTAQQFQLRPRQLLLQVNFSF